MKLVDVVITKPNDQIVLATANGMAIRFSKRDARPMAETLRGSKVISLRKEDEVVGMVVADQPRHFSPRASLVTANVPPSDLVMRWPGTATVDMRRVRGGPSKRSRRRGTGSRSRGSQFCQQIPNAAPRR